MVNEDGGFHDGPRETEEYEPIVEEVASSTIHSVDTVEVLGMRADETSANREERVVALCMIHVDVQADINFEEGRDVVHLFNLKVMILTRKGEEGT